MAEKILIFGATGAVGSSLAKQLQNNSINIHLIGKNKDELSKLSEETSASFSVADVTDPNFIENIDKDLKDTNIAGISYCVGSIDLKPINLVTKKDYLKSLELNFFPIVEIIKKYKDNLKKNKASIVLFSTVAVKQGFPNHSIISPVKASLEGLTVSLAAELAPNVRVNCIAPSLSNSKMAGRILGNTKIAEGIAKQHPLKRVGEGSDSASLAKFLLSNESSWITGQIIGVDGGRSNVG
jgi:NAD(P)-dependent dehydrogenase (short-subunit alcohol dehydrogenase family)